MTPETCPHCAARVINLKAANCWQCGASFTESGSPVPKTIPPIVSDAMNTEPSRSSASDDFHEEQAVDTGLQTEPSPGRSDRPPSFLGNTDHELPRPTQLGDFPATLLFGLVALFILFFLTLFGLVLANAMGLALILLVIGTPALIRVLYISIKRDSASKREWKWVQKVLYVMAVIGVVTMVFIASLAAGCATCFATILVMNRRRPPIGLSFDNIIIGAWCGVFSGVGVCILLFGYLLWRRKV